MNLVGLLYEFSVWLRAGERWNVIALVICILAAGYVIALIIHRAKAERDAARAAVQESSRIAARGYHQSARN